MKYFMLVLLALLTACGLGGKDGKDGSDGYSCIPKVDDSGTLFVCSDGQSYRVDNGTLGPVGPKGEQGQIGPQGLPGKDGVDGKDGQDGKGLTVESTKVCNGEIEGWLENTAYKIEFKTMLFSTGNVLAASKVSLLRAEETINSRDAAQFFVDENSEITLDMGVMSVALEGDVLKVTSKGGIEAEIACEVK